MGFHEPVLQKEVFDLWHSKPGGFYVDGTLGTGGHSLMILKQDPNARLLGIDADQAALKIAEDRLYEYKNRITLVHSNFSRIPEVLNFYKFGKADGFLCDLGVSSIQLDSPERGFSFRTTGALDMRMDAACGESAESLIRRLSIQELAKIIKTYGEEKFSNRIAAALKKLCATQKSLNTRDCARAIEDCIPAYQRKRSIHPATKTFMAIRIAVNREIENLKELLKSAPSFIQNGGRFLAVSFHSLEDRLIKQSMKDWLKGCLCPSDFPQCACGKTPEFKLLTKKPLVPTETEIQKNPRARSAKLRAAEKC